MTGAILAAVITNIVATIGFAIQINSRIDTMGSQLTGRIDAMGARLDTRIDALGEAFIRHDHGAR